ncbi:MAG: hypothetical protein ABL940_09275, partial [Bacteroidia bacterium]
MKFNQTYLCILIIIFVYACGNERQKSDIVQIIQLKKYHSFIDSLKANDTLFINFRTDGCEHHFTEKIKIYKRSEGVFAELNINSRTKPPLTTLLSDSSLIAYGQFENEGKNLEPNWGCTTSQEFIISLKIDSIKFEDRGCKFDGYYKLKNQFFGQSVIK